MNTSSDTSNTASLILQTEALVADDGTVTFENLGISQALSSVKLEYFILKPVGVNTSNFNPMNVVTNPITSTQPLLNCKINEEGLVVNASEVFSVTVSLIDRISSQKIKNIAWKVGNF